MKYPERLEYYQKLYFHEIEMREKIEARKRTPLSTFAVVFALIAYLANTIFEKQIQDLGFAFWLFFPAAMLTFVVSLYYFCRSYLGYHYLLMPTAEVLEGYRIEMREHYLKIDNEHAIQWTEEKYEDYLFSKYISYSTQNTKNNDAMSVNLNYCIRYLITSFILVCAAYFPFFIMKLSGA